MTFAYQTDIQRLDREILESAGEVAVLRKTIARMQEEFEKVTKAVFVLAMESELMGPMPKEKAPEAVKPAEPVGGICGKWGGPRDLTWD